MIVEKIIANNITDYILLSDEYFFMDSGFDLDFIVADLDEVENVMGSYSDDKVHVYIVSKTRYEITYAIYSIDRKEIVYVDFMKSFLVENFSIDINSENVKVKGINVLNGIPKKIYYHYKLLTKPRKKTKYLNVLDIKSENYDTTDSEAFLITQGIKFSEVRASMNLLMRFRRKIRKLYVRDRFIIVFSGCDGAGKTEISRRVSLALNRLGFKNEYFHYSKGNDKKTMPYTFHVFFKGRTRRVLKLLAYTLNYCSYVKSVDQKKFIISDRNLNHMLIKSNGHLSKFWIFKSLLPCKPQLYISLKPSVENILSRKREKTKDEISEFYRSEKRLVSKNELISYVNDVGIDQCVDEIIDKIFQLNVYELSSFYSTSKN